MRAAIALTMTCALLLVPATDAAAKKKKKKKKKARAKADAPAFVTALTPDHGTILAFLNPLVHAQATLDSSVTAQTLELLKRAGEEGLPTVAEMHAELEGAAASIPLEAVMGVTGAGVKAFGTMAQLVLIGQLAEGARAADDAGAEATLHGEFARLLGGLDVSGLTLYGKLRDPALASMAIVSASGLLGGATQDQPGLKGTFEERVVGLEVDMGPNLTPEDVTSVLQELGVISREAAAPQAIVDAARGLKVQVWLERHGEDGLRFTLGPRPGKRAKKLKAKKLGKNWRGAPEDVIWMRWDMESIVGEVEAWVALFDRWAATPTGKAARAAHGDLSSNAHQARNFVDQQAGSGDLRIGAIPNGLDGVGFEAKPKPLAPVGETELVRFLTGAAGLVAADQRMPVSDLLVAMAGGMAEVVEARDLIARVVSLMTDRAPTVFAPGMALVSGWGDTVRTVELVMKDGDETERMTAKQLPNYGLVFVASLAEGQDGVAFVESLLREAAGITCNVLGQPLPADAAVFPSRDLGLGVVTHAFDWGWVSGCTEGALTVRVDGDLTVHAFQQGSSLVISSSLALSERVLAAYGGSGSRARVPEPTRKKGHVTGFARLDGSLVGGWITMAADWMAAFGADPDDVAELRLVADMARLLRRFEQTITDTKKKGRWTTMSLTVH